MKEKSNRKKKKKKKKKKKNKKKKKKKNKKKKNKEKSNSSITFLMDTESEHVTSKFTMLLHILSSCGLI